MGFLHTGDAGRTAMVTGGASGMGLAVATRLALRGMNVVIADRADQATLDAAVAEIAKTATHGAKVIAVRMDVTLPDDYERLRERVYQEFGDCALIFLNADNEVQAVYSGFSGPATGDAYTQQRERFEALIEGMINE